jgi:hypothetical protein
MHSLIVDELCDDLFTFRTELKKVIIPIAKRAYDIFPQAPRCERRRLKSMSPQLLLSSSRAVTTSGSLTRLV